MTPRDIKIWRKVVLRGIGAVVFSWMIVCACVWLLSTHGFSPEHTHRPATAIQAIQFPENEQQLDEAAARLAKEGEALSNLKPAAGSSRQKKEIVAPAKTGGSAH